MLYVVCIYCIYYSIYVATEVLLIRDAVDDDFSSILAIYSFFVLNSTATFEEDPPTLDEMLSRKSTVLSNGLPYVVACLNDVVVGYAYALPYRSRSAYRYTIESSVYVDHTMSRRKIGHSLMTQLIHRCEAPDTEWRQIIAVIGGGEANVASIGLHLSLGFTRVGLLPAVGFKFGQWIDSAILQRALVHSVSMS
jgi:phosphinothricin acetyltransferase